MCKDTVLIDLSIKEGAKLVFHYKTILLHLCCDKESPPDVEVCIPGVCVRMYVCAHMHVCACKCVCVYEPVIGTEPADVKDTNWVAESIVFILFQLQLLY